MLARIAAGVMGAMGAMGVIVLFEPVSAKDAVGARARAWVASVVERVEGTAALVAATTRGRTVRTIDVHLCVAADGTVQDVAFGNPLLMDALEKRLRGAVLAAGPFGPPPTALLAPDGTTDFDFPMRVSDRR